MWVRAVRGTILSSVSCAMRRSQVTFHNDILWCFITQISYTEEACREVACPCQMRLCLGTRTPGVWRTTEDFLDPQINRGKKNSTQNTLHHFLDSINPIFRLSNVDMDLNVYLVCITIYNSEKSSDIKTKM